MLNYQIFGGGDDLFVGLHGWNGSLATFEPLSGYVPESATLLSLDLPGYGESAPPEEWTLDAIAGSIVDTVEHVAPGRRFTLVGSCSGAVVGLYVGRCAGPRMQRFVLLEPFAYVPFYLRIFVFPIVGLLFYWSAFANPLGRWIGNIALSGKRQDQTDMMASFSRGSPWVPHRYLQLFDDVPSAHTFEDLRMPKTIVLGEYTFDAVRESAQIWSSVWQTSQFEELPGTGHLILDESPQAVSRLIFSQHPALTENTS